MQSSATFPPLSLPPIDEMKKIQALICKSSETSETTGEKESANEDQSLDVGRLSRDNRLSRQKEKLFNGEKIL